DRHLARAFAVAETLTSDLAAETDGLLWEHYDESWTHDFEHNRDDPEHTFRPWGYQPGHHVEWAKLLLLLDRHRSEPWLARRAGELFDAAVELGWDEEHGGFYYTVDLNGDPVVDDKYGWAVAEAIGASALLREVDDAYDDWYDRLWSYARERFVDRGHGNWYGKLDREGERPSPNRGVAVEPG
ncbi:AGE family epimerase/isomerase, partial [Halobium palmae]